MSPVVHSVSQATRLCGSCSKIASSTASLIWSDILSGWPSVTDSDVKVRLMQSLFWSSKRATLSRMTPARSDFASSGNVSIPPSASRRTARLVSTSKPASGCEMSLPTIRSRRLVRSLLGRVARRGRRSRPRTRPAPDPAASSRPRSTRKSWVGSSTISGMPSCFLSLRLGGSLGRKSATAAAITITSVAGARPSTASCISAAVCTDTISTPDGAGRPMVVTSVTSAPRRAATSAMA